MSFTLILILLLAASLLFYHHTRSITPKGLQPAPSPPGLPFLGHAHKLGSNPHRQIMLWSRTYGELFKIRLGLHDWYMVCSPSAVKEVMDRQSKDSSSRPPMPVASEALSGGLRFLFMGYGGMWRRLRGVSHKLLTPEASRLFRPSQEWEARLMVEEILKGGGGGKDGRGSEVGYRAVRRYAVSVIMTSTYGRRISDWDCDEVREIYGIMNDFSNIAAPGTYLADTLPFLGCLPSWLQWWRKPLKPFFDRQAHLWMSFFTSLKTQMETGKAPECFVKQLIESDYEKQGISEIQAAFLAGSLIEAGSETTSATANSAILHLAAYPDVRQKAYEELDRVVGSSRSPTFEDEENLPYIRAIVKETMRIRPVTNSGQPHYTTGPIIYKNMYIPAGSVVALQQYAIHHDPTLFPDPSRFNPDRYLAFPERSGFYATGAASSRDHWNFGAGRRICSGIHLAENSMFIVLAKLLWAFDIRPPVDESGREIEIDSSDDAYEPGANTIPKPFRVRWIARSEEIRETIEREGMEARRDGYVLRGLKVGEEGIEA